MSVPIHKSFTPADTDADGIAESQTGSTSLTLDGALVSDGVAVLDVQRKVTVTSDGNESAKTITLTGNRIGGGQVTETLTGPNATTVTSVKDYKEITAVTFNTAPAGNITVGTADSLSLIFPRDAYKDNHSFSVAVYTGSATIAAQLTMQDLLSTISDGPYGVNWQTMTTVDSSANFNIEKSLTGIRFNATNISGSQFDIDLLQSEV